MGASLMPSSAGLPTGAGGYASYSGLTPGSGPSAMPAGGGGGNYTPAKTVFGKVPGVNPQTGLGSGWGQPSLNPNYNPNQQYQPGTPMQNQFNWAPQTAQPFGGAQSMPAMYGQGGQLNLASMAPGSQIGQMAQRMGGQSPGLTGFGGVPQQQPFPAAQQFATNAQVNPQLQAQQFGQQGAFNPQQMGTMGNMQGMAGMGSPRINPSMMQGQLPQPSLTVPAGFTGAATMQPPGFTGGLRKAPMGYKPPGRF